MSALLAAADAEEPTFRRAWMRSVAYATGAHLSIEALEQAYASGTPANVLGAIPWLPFMADLTDRMLPAYTQVYAAGHAVGQRDIPNVGKQQQKRTAAAPNPRAADWVQRHAADLVRGVTEESKQAIRALLLDMFQRGVTPTTAAKAVRDHIGLTPRQSTALWRFQLGFQDKLAAGTLTQRQVNEKVADYRNQLLASRAKMIARTEAMTATNQGQQAAWQDADALGLLPGTVQREWLITPDERLCKICAPVPKEGPVGLREAFILGDGAALMAPPAHPSCRCTLRLIFPAGVV